MKSTPDSDFAELIGENYESEHYIRLKNIVYNKKRENQYDIDTVTRISMKELEYRKRNYRRVLKYIVDISTQKTTASPINAIGDITDSNNKWEAMLSKLDLYDPANAELFRINYNKAAAAAKERRQEQSSLSSEENTPESLSDSSTESKRINHTEQEMKNQSKNPRKEGNAEKYEEIDTISGEGSKKGGEAGLVPRTYSMGAQPPSLNQPL
ncbi:hypothetical protein JTB14_034826 [Gonioctena quinquepunctata]|nr:hypothetical protein JTB14_034826 [Gonioctena quinquepunctata]